MNSIWDKDLLTGVSEIDAEHLGLLTTLNTLHRIVTANTQGDLAPALLEKFRTQVEQHFRTEEQQMQRGYRLAPSHVAQHRRFMQELDQTLESWCAAESGRQVDLDYIAIWFARHIEISDKPLATWILQQ